MHGGVLLSLSHLDAAFNSDGIKVCAIIVYLIGFLFGPVIYRIRYGGRIKERMRNEQGELRLQKQKEEQGKWK